MKLEDCVSTLESMIIRDTGRGVEQLASATRGDMLRAANELVADTANRVVLVTGFPIPKTDSGIPETDGPIGVAVLASACRALDLRVEVVTDQPCASIVQAALTGFGGLEDVPLHSIQAAPPAESLAAVVALSDLLKSRSTSHLIYVERPGPSADGQYRSMRGVSLPDIAPLERLASLLNVFVIGIGDGGNEVGMGRLPRGLVERFVPYGDLIASVTSCDALITAAISNWGASALAASMLVSASPRSERNLHPLSVDRHEAALRHAVRAGAIDGVTGKNEPSVDGFVWPDYRQVLVAIATMAELCE